MEQNPKERLARSLFFETGKTQKQIADIVGVSEKTIYLWMKQGDWKRLRSASKLMPSMIVENFLSQVQELNEEIRQREQGKRYPTVQEAEVFRKMVMTIGRIQKGHTQGEYSEMMQKFLSFIMPRNHELVITLSYYADDFLKFCNPDGFTPFDTAYDPAPPKPDPHILQLNKVTRFLQKQQLPLLRGDSPVSANTEDGQGCVQLGNGPCAENQEPIANNSYNTSLSLPVPHPCGREGRGEAKTPDDSSTDEKDKQETTRTPLLVTDEKDKPVTTRNETQTSYGITVLPFSDTPAEKAEIKNEPETGNISPSPSMEKGPGDEVIKEHVPGLTWRTPEGILKLIPPYQSKEYYEIPLYIRERLYTMSGEPIKDRKVSKYF